MKKLIMILMSATLFLFNGISAFALDLDDFVTDEPIIEEYVYTRSANSSLYFSGKTAYCSSSVYGYSGTTTKIVVNQYLQKKSGSSWSNVWSWHYTFNTWYCNYDNSRSSLASGTYRVKTVAKVYSGSNYETVTTYSGMVSC